jgi:hypothetical protein
MELFVDLCPPVWVALLSWICPLAVLVAHSTPSVSVGILLVMPCQSPENMLFIFIVIIFINIPSNRCPPMGFNGASQLMLPDEDQRNQPTKVAGRRSTQPANKSCRTS